MLVITSSNPSRAFRCALTQTFCGNFPDLVAALAEAILCASSIDNCANESEHNYAPHSCKSFTRLEDENVPKNFLALQSAKLLTATSVSKCPVQQLSRNEAFINHVTAIYFCHKVSISTEITTVFKTKN